MKPTRESSLLESFRRGQIDRRELLRRGTALGLGAAALTSLRLRSASAQTDPASFEGEVTFWHGMTTEAAIVTNEIIPAFVAMYPNVSVNPLQVPFDQLQDKYTTEASAGGGCDVILGPPDWLGGFVESEIIRPLNELGSDEFAASYNPAAIAGLTFDEQLYAVPQNINGVALVYNKTLMPEPPATTDDLLAAAATIGATEGTFGFGIFPQFYNNAGYLYGFGGAALTDDSQSGFSSPETVAWLTFLQTLTAAPGVFVGQDQNAVESLFNEGKLAAMMNGPWFTQNASENIGAENFGVAVLPTVASASNAPAKPFVGIQGLYLNSNPDEDQARLALEFARFFSVQGTQALAEQAGQLPASNDVTLPASNPNAQIWLDQYATGVPLPTDPKMGQVWEPADDMLNKVLNGDATPEEAAADAAETINSAGS